MQTCKCFKTMRNFTGGIYCLGCNRQIDSERVEPFWYAILIGIVIAALVVALRP